jgi:ribosomal protein S18 acetylase RimI-like enzyme
MPEGFCHSGDLLDEACSTVRQVERREGQGKLDNMAVLFRRATEGDLDSMWMIWKDIMDQRVYYPYDSESYSRHDIEVEWINLTKNTIFVIVQHECIVAAYILKANQPGYGKHIANAAYMVDTKHRGQGLGDQLCRHSLETAKQEGYRGIQFNLVVSTNTAAMRVWKQNGFQIIGTIPGGFYHSEIGYIDAYIFYKSLLH